MSGTSGVICKMHKIGGAEHDMEQAEGRQDWCEALSGTCKDIRDAHGQQGLVPLVLGYHYAISKLNFDAQVAHDATFPFVISPYG